jgi:hypothetical protein
MRAIMVVVAVLSAALPAMSADTPYLDNRSDPAGLIQSLYNAINRKEYARAWSYFSTKPAANLEAYAEGYADTAEVRVAIGIASAHDSDGTLFYYVPVAIQASDADGDAQTYGGCYELRLADPQLQGEDFAPLHIADGKLASASGGLYDAMPATCDDLGVPDQAAMLEHRARALYRDAFAEQCDLGMAARDSEEAMSSYEIRFRYSYASASDTESKARLYRFLCGRGAYNESHVFIMADDSNQLKALSFATPDLDIRYQDDDYEKAVDSITVIGFRAAQELVNSDFDPDTLTLTSFAKWRGVGDASSVGTWILRDGEFSLTRYDVDASYDGEINPETVIDYHSGP